ncbi:unnamed protein product, partial [Mesorhabditis belari]|uniref:Maestro heat-like repeat-containing protein family member 1 n=1 Tax=Mesorhabditis belari TaxID=2138241 RepID=A0AAF3FA39_9BILA
MSIQSLEDLITSLLDTLGAANDDVKTEVAEALVNLGQNQYRTTLKTIHTYLIQHNKIAPHLRSFLLRSMTDVVSNSKVLDAVDEQTMLLVINLATQELSMTKDTELEWADASKDLLVTIGKSQKHVSHVLDAVLQKFPPGFANSPHRYVVVVLGKIAEHNPQGFVHFLTDVLSRAIPLLPNIRGDTLRCSWARAICYFCEAVRESESAVREVKEDTNIAQEQSSTNRLTYCDQFETVFEVIFTWMSSKDSKVRAEAAECIGELCLMVRKQKLIDDLKKLVTTFLGLYKKSSSENHTITQGLCRFLEATCMDDIVPLDPYLDELLAVLFPHTCLDPDDSNASPSQSAIKNHSEAFRCFHVAANRFADRIVYFLLHKMQHTQDMQKLGAINVMRHLLNSSGSSMEDKRSLVMMGLRRLLAAEQVATIRVKRAIVQLCVALSDHAYVDAEGGQHVIAFLVRNVINQSDDQVGKRGLTDDVAGLNQLRTQCAQALHTIASTSSCANRLLWPYLLEFICVKEYTPVMADLCKCLRTLIVKTKEMGQTIDYQEGFEKEKVAGKYQVFARLFVMMCCAPLNGLLGRRARETLGFLGQIGDWLHPSISAIVAEHQDGLSALIEELSTSVWTDSQKVGEAKWRRVSRWNEAVLEFLAVTVLSVNDGEWRQEVAAAFGKQLELYKEMQHEKAFALRCLSMVLSSIANTTFIIDHTQLMFRSTNHATTAERVGCAKGIGAIARIHMDLILTQLENISKWEHSKKNQSWFGFVKGSYTDIEMVQLRATLMLCYGHVAFSCPTEAVTQRVEQTIVPFLRTYMTNQKQEVVVREALLETIRLIAEALSPTRIGPDYSFELRNELFTFLKDCVQLETSETLSSSIRLLACRAVASLVCLMPRLTNNEVWELSNILVKTILPISREKSGLKTNEEEDSATIMDATVSHLGCAIEAIIRNNSSLSIVTQILQILQTFYGSSADHERLRAIDLTVLSLRVYFESAEDVQLGHASDFPPFSSILARMAPRAVDSVHSVRVQALLALHSSLRLAYIFKGHSRETDLAAFSITEITEKYNFEEGKLDGQTAKKVVKHIAQIIEANLPPSQQQTYLSALFDMLGDRQNQVSSASAQLLSNSLACRGATLHNEGATIVSSILSKLPEIHGCVQTYTDLLASLCAFYSHQQYVVIDVLLEQPLPYSKELCDAWECISRERALFPSLLDYILELMFESFVHPYDLVEIGGGTSVKVCNAKPLVYASALTELLKGGEPESAIEERFPILLATLIQLLTSVSGTQFPVVQKDSRDTGVSSPLLITAELRRSMEKPAGLAVAVIRTLLQRMRLTDIIEEMNTLRSWSECLDANNFLNSIAILTCAIVEHMPKWAEPLADRLMEKVTSEQEPLRLAAVTVVSALIKKSPNQDGRFDERLLVDCVNALQNTLKDESLRIRKLCVRGLGEIGECVNLKTASKFTAVAVVASMQALDDIGDRRDEVAMEAIISLNKLVRRAADSQLKEILPQVLLKIRPCFEKESAFLRASAFSLFGELGRRVGEETPEFLIQLHSNIVSILLHFGEDDQPVQQACGTCLRVVGRLFTSDPLSQLIDRSVMPNGSPSVSYYLLQKDVAMILALSYPDYVNTYALSCSNYFKSTSSIVRVNAAHFTGHLLGCLTPPLRATISKELIFTGLVSLLKDESIFVRIAATKAIAQLHQFS